jgi:flagellar basal body-associated protein FliL
MDTATSVQPALGVAPDVNDPENDIDGKTTIFWLVLSTIVVFASVYLLYVFFAFAIQDERAAKLENPEVPAPVQQLRAQEAQSLSAGEGRVSIDEAIQKLADRKAR